MSNGIGPEYLQHPIFGQLTEYGEFYNSISESTMGFIAPGTSSGFNIDTYMFSSMQGTLESIHDVLKKGRINDAYALLRKFYDSTIINIYTILYLKENYCLDNFVVEKINNWVKGEEKIPSFKVMSKYITSSARVSEITQLLYKEGSFKGSSFETLRQRCTDHTHYLYYHNLLSNDNSVSLPNRNAMLTNFSNDLTEIFIMHLAYLFYLNDHYMVASDYIDCLDLGIQPEENSQYFVATFVQEIFDKVLNIARPDIVIVIKGNTEMMLK